MQRDAPAGGFLSEGTIRRFREEVARYKPHIPCQKWPYLTYIKGSEPWPDRIIFSGEQSNPVSPVLPCLVRLRSASGHYLPGLPHIADRRCPRVHSHTAGRNPDRDAPSAFGPPTGRFGCYNKYACRLAFRAAYNERYIRWNRRQTT